MKKIAIIAIIALVVIGCVLAAGCTSNQSQQNAKDTTMEKPQVTPAVTISLNDVHKTGNSFNIGDIVELRLLSNPTTGYAWEVTSKDNGLDITQNYIADDNSDGRVGVGGTTIFWFKAEKPGTYNFTLKYMKSWEGEKSAIATYSDRIIVEEKPEAIGVDGPVLSIVYDTFNINPKVGETVLVKIRGNATTGFRWSASGDGLIIGDEYKVDDAPKGMTGVPGTFLFSVRANKAGTYTLKITDGKAGNPTPLTTIEIPLIFQ